MVMENSIFIDRLRDILKRNPGSLVFLSLAHELKKMGKIDEAIKILEDGIQRNPDFIAARFTIGKLYLLRGMYLQAEKEFNAVIQMGPDNDSRKRLAENCRRSAKTINRLFNLLSLIQSRLS